MITSNPWQKFKNLIPGGRRFVVTVASNNGDGTSTVTMADGTSTMRVAGEGVTAGGKGLVIDGELRQALPSLPNESVTLY